MRVSSVTPARNDATDLRASIEAILGQSRRVDEIVIAVGPSTDETAAVAAELARVHPAVIVVDNHDGSTPVGLNRAIEAATGEVIVRVDARSILPADYVAHAIAALEETGAGNVGAVQRPVGRGLVQRGIAAAMRSVLGSGGAAYRGTATRRPVDTAWLGVFRRNALDDVGGYDERFLRNQDAELNARLNTAGHQVWVDPGLAVDYLPRTSLLGLLRQYWQYGWWRAQTVRRHPDSLALRQLAAPVIVVVVGTSLLATAVLRSPWSLVPLGGYCCVVLASGAQSGDSIAEGVIAAASLAIMHLAWGSAFLISVVRVRVE